MWTHRRQRSHCMRSRSAESPSPPLQWKQGGSSSSVGSGLSLANSLCWLQWIADKEKNSEGYVIARIDLVT